jgi:hypothetical protein
LKDMEFSYAYSEGTKNPADNFFGKTSNSSEVIKFLDKLKQPKRSVSISFGVYSESTGSDWVEIDFSCFKDARIETEIMPHCDDKNFATVDISMAKQIVDVMFKLSEIKLFREKLQELPIKWIC